MTNFTSAKSIPRLNTSVVMRTSNLEFQMPKKNAGQNKSKSSNHQTFKGEGMAFALLLVSIHAMHF